MPAGFSRILLTACAIIATTLPAAADNPTFSELLARAQAQAAAGHRWTPAGDNMTETVVTMMDLIPTATAEELTKLSKLLEDDKLRPPSQAPGAATATEEAQPAADSAPSADPSTPPPATDTTVAVPVRPTQPAINTASVIPVRPIPRIVDTVAAIPVRPAPNNARPVAPSPGPRAMELFARGQQAELRGDVSAARRFYSSAAQQGHALAARGLGRLYDPAYLKQTALGGIDPDPAMARHWYEQAITMGDAEAGPLLQALSLR